MHAMAKGRSWKMVEKKLRESTVGFCFCSFIFYFFYEKVYIEKVFSVYQLQRWKEFIWTKNVTDAFIKNK